MSEARKDQPEIKKAPAITPAPERNDGILKKKEQQDLETRILETLKHLNNKLTKKEISSLLSRLEATHSLEDLRKELQKEKKIDQSILSDETLQSILDLIRESRDLVKSNIEELKLEISKLNPSLEYELDHDRAYITKRFPWIKKMEESPLYKNIVIDVAGVAVGAIDSAYAVLKLFLRLLVDLVKLPKDVVKAMKR